MISRSVISMELVLFFLFGVIPTIVGIVLLITKKVKGSCFWCGVVGCIIYSLIIALAAVPFAVDPEKLAQIQSQEGTIYVTLLFIGVAVLEISRLICTGAVLKKHRTFKGAVSFGVGYTILSMIGTGFSMISYYLSSAKINNGSFDLQYISMIDQGYMTKEQLIQSKQIFLDMSVKDLALMIPTIVFTVIIGIALSVLLVKGLREKYGFLSFVIALAVSGGNTAAGVFIDNAYIPIVISCALAVAGLVYICRVKGSMAEEPETSVIPDNFMNSINAVQTPADETPAINLSKADEIDNSVQ